MRLFLDSSVLLAAVGSESGASRFVVENAEQQGWILLTAPYCTAEALHNLPKFGPVSGSVWRKEIVPRLEIVPTVVSLDKALVFPKAKDRPVVLSALAAECEVLLTLDRRDFERWLGRQVYSLRLLMPGDFLLEQRQAGRI
jgi:predicted nucleic acid-binding protein